MNILIGTDNTDGKNYDVYLEDGYLSCEAYDWVYDVTEAQEKTIRLIGANQELMQEITGDNSSWFNPASK